MGLMSGLAPYVIDTTHNSMYAILHTIACSSIPGLVRYIMDVAHNSIFAHACIKLHKLCNITNLRMGIHRRPAYEMEIRCICVCVCVYMKWKSGACACVYIYVCL